MKLRTHKVSEIDHASTGAKARELRISKKKSLRSVAIKLRFSPAFLSDLERGRRNWNAELLKRYTRALT